MTRDDIIRMAREVGFDVDKKDGTYEVFEDDGYYIQTDRVIKLAALVAAAEREACAMVCGSLDETDMISRYDYRRGVLDCADAIRARGKE